MPKRMLRNRTLVQAIRMAFGISGIVDEDEAGTIIDVTPQPEPAPEPARRGRPPGFTVQCQLTYDHPMISKQEVSFEITPESYMKEIAGARTFCFDYEVEALKRKGLARGGSLDNAVVIGIDRIHNKEKSLRWPDEFARHKILDFMGDLFLLGQRVQGKVTAVKVGHGHNINFVKEIVKTKSNNPIGELAQ
jgi:UDP-3-O-acyl-N-acetylglucosamine deacetylase